MGNIDRIGPITNQPSELVAYRAQQDAERRGWRIDNDAARQRLASERAEDKRRQRAAARIDAKQKRQAELDAIERELRLQGASEREIEALVPQIRAERLRAAATAQERPRGYEPL